MKSSGSRWFSVFIILALLWAFLPAQKVNAATYITTTTVWPMGMPMVDDVVVQNGATLTILPGSVIPINCSDTAPHPGGLDPNRVEIIVENGMLIIDGAVLMDPGGTAGCWYGIEFRPGTAGLIQYSVIKDAVIGITANTANVNIIQNVIMNMRGQDAILAGVPAGMGAGILLMGTPTMANIIANNINYITGGNGLPGFAGFPGAITGANGTDGGNGGDGGLAAGIYLSSVLPPAMIDSNEISHIQGGSAGVGGNGGNGAGGANQQGMIPPQGGGNGGKGGPGGNGGDAVGIYSTGSDFISLNNTIEDIYGAAGSVGGNGGNGGKGGNALLSTIEPGMPAFPGANGGNGGAGGIGGVGGEATGIYVDANSIGLMDHNTISDVFGGMGGNGGNGGNGGPGGNGGTGGNAMEPMPPGMGGNGGNGGGGGSGGTGGNGGWAEGIFSDQSMPNLLDRNTVHDVDAGSGGIGGLGGSGASGGTGGNGGTDLMMFLPGAPGGMGGNGGPAGLGGGGGIGGAAIGVGLYGNPALITPVTNTDIWDIVGGGGGAAGNGGNGGAGGMGGNGGAGIIVGAGGNGGNGGDAGYQVNIGGSSGFASGIDVVNTGPTLTNNTIVDIISFEYGGAGGSQGATGSVGLGGIGNPPGLPGLPGNAGGPSGSGSGNNAIGIYLETSIGGITQVFNNIVVNHINNSPSTMDIGIYQWATSGPVLLDYNDVWNWTTLYSPTAITGANDISLAPHFEGSYNHRLLANSPCVDTALDTAFMRPADDNDFVPRNQDGNRDGIPGVDRGAFERWVISVDKASDHTPQQLLAKGDTVVYTLTIRTVNMGPKSSATTVSLSDTLPAGMTLVGPVVCPAGMIASSSTSFSWSGQVSGAQDETCVYSAKVTSFQPSFSNSAEYTDRDGTWTTNTVVNYWNYQVFLPLIVR